MSKGAIVVALVFAMSACAGMERSCSAGCAEAYAADWVVVQMAYDGTPYRCWVLDDTSVANEREGVGIYWLSPDGHLVHLGGHYNRIQVEGERWDEALAEVGLTRETCEAVQARRHHEGAN